MSKQYTCDLCKKVFTQKIDFTRHQQKKTSCITLTELQQITQIQKQQTDEKNMLINVFKNCLNILRDNEGLTGDKALRNLSYLLILKLLEPHFGGEINIDDYEYDFSHIPDEFVEKHKIKLLEIARFSNLSKEKEDNLTTNIKFLWDDIFSENPATKNIFLKEKGFDIKRSSTYKKLIDKLNSIDLSKTEYDVLGNAYEEVIQDIMTGKVLGQFFTQPLIKKMMVKLIDPQIHPDGKIDTCGDPTMGTGGFLITYLQYILKQAASRNIKPDWNFIKNEGLYGKELEPDTYQLAVSNMLISSGHMFEKLDRGDSIREPITRKFDNILANPPFGIKGLQYDDFRSSLKNEYVPIKTDNAVSLFIQAIIYMLKINGKCAVVLPDGQDLFSKTNTTLVAIREYLIKTCDLKEIIYLPSGIFTYTSIKTCVFYFVKKREGTNVLKTKIKTSKREYTFSKTHQTTKVKFYDYNPYEDVKNLLVEVPIDKIANNSYSFNYAEYIKDESEEVKYAEGVIVKTLGEICEIDKNLKKYDTSHGKSEGIYKFHTGGERTDLYVNECDIRELYIIQNRTNGSGKCNLYLDKNFSLAKQTIAYRALNKDENTTKYIYYYLLFNKDILEKGFIGANHKNISKEYISNIKIPIPPIDKQQELVTYLDFIYEKATKTSNEKIAELKQLNAYCLNNQKLFGENVNKTLGELCNFKAGKFNSKDCKEQGKYPFYTCKAENPSGFSDEYCFDYEKYLILIKDGGAGEGKYSDKIGLGKVFKVYGKSSATSNLALIPKDINNFEFLYYYLQFIKNKIMDMAHYTVNLGHIKKVDIENLKIPVPSLERQKQIVEYCEYNDTLIKQLEKEIENNKKQALEFITGIMTIKQEQSEQQQPPEQLEQDQSNNVVSPLEDKEIIIDSKPKPKSIIDVKNKLVSLDDEIIINPVPKVKKTLIKKKITKEDS